VVSGGNLVDGAALGDFVQRSISTGVLETVGTGLKSCINGSKLGADTSAFGPSAILEAGEFTTTVAFVDVSLLGGHASVASISTRETSKIALDGSFVGEKTSFKLVGVVAYQAERRRSGVNNLNLAVLDSSTVASSILTSVRKRVGASDLVVHGARNTSFDNTIMDVTASSTSIGIGVAALNSGIGGNHAQRGSSAVLNSDVVALGGYVVLTVRTEHTCVVTSRVGHREGTHFVSGHAGGRNGNRNGFVVVVLSRSGRESVCTRSSFNGGFDGRSCDNRGHSIAKDNGELYWVGTVVAAITCGVLDNKFTALVVVNLVDFSPLWLSNTLVGGHYKVEILDETIVDSTVVVVVDMSYGKLAVPSLDANFTNHSMTLKHTSCSGWYTNLRTKYSLIKVKTDRRGLLVHSKSGRGHVKELSHD